MSRKSLAADIDDLLNVAPRDYDPEDEPGYDAMERDSYQGPEGDEDDAPVDVPDGRLRLKGGLHESFDPEDSKSAYAGRRTSRSDLESDGEDEDEEDESEGEEDESDEEDDEREDAAELSESSEASEDGSSGGSGGEDDHLATADDASDDDEEDAPQLLSSSFAKARRQGSSSGGPAAGGGNEPDDVTRGTHIKTQKQLWDSLLQLRMRLQPAMESARQLPRSSTQMVLRSAASDAAAAAAKPEKKAGKAKKRKAAAEQVAQRLGGAVEGLQSVEKELCGLLGDLGDLQQALASNNSDVSDSVAKRRKIVKPPSSKDGAAGDDSGSTSDSDADGDAGNEEGSAETSGAARRSEWEYLSWEYGLLEPHMLQTIDRWGRRVQNKAMGLGLGKGVAFKSLNKPVSAQVNELMQSSRERLLQRTRLKRAQYRVLGTAKPERAADGSEKRDEAALEEAAELGLQPSTHEYDEEVYDDSDLYQNLLKELVENGMSEQGGGQQGNEWLLAAQQRHQSKLHRKVDRKASKGRKTRYTIMQELVNFMAPVSTGADTGEHDDDDDEDRVDVSRLLVGNLFRSVNA